jgi:ketosteroid isomerase-like protein
MSADDLAVAQQFLAALAAAAKTGELEDVYEFLAADVEWVTPTRNLRSIGEVRNEMTWFSPRETREIDFGVSEERLTDLGKGRIATDFREVYTAKSTGELAYARERRIELTVRDGKIARYEMRFAG